MKLSTHPGTGAFHVEPIIEGRTIDTGSLGAGEDAQRERERERILNRYIIDTITTFIQARKPSKHTNHTDLP